MAPYEIDEYGNVIYVPGGSSRPSTPSYVSGGGMSTLPPSTSVAITADDTIGGWGGSTSTSTAPTVVATVPRERVEANRYYQTQPAPTPSRPSGMYGITPDPFEEEIMRPKPTPTTSTTTPSTPTVVATIPRERVEANRYYQTQPAPTPARPSGMYGITPDPFEEEIMRPKPTPTTSTTTPSTPTVDTQPVPTTSTTVSTPTGTTTPTTTKPAEEKKPEGFLDWLFKPIRDFFNSLPPMSEEEKRRHEEWLREQEIERRNIMQNERDDSSTRPITGGGTQPGAGGGGGTPSIAEEQPKPPQTTNYMSYGFIAIIAILVIVLIFVLRRK